MSKASSQLEQYSENVWLYRPMAVMRTGGAVQVYSGASLNELIHSDGNARILFYDIFRSPDGRTVVAVQAAEFADEFGEWKAYCNGKELKRRRISPSLPRRPIGRLKVKMGLKHHLQYVVVWILKIPAACRAEDPLKLEIVTSDERLSIDVPASPFRKWDKVALTQQCIQKDYPLVWVRDHFLFYHRAHGYGRVILYDNDSSEFEQLLRELSKLDKGLQIVVVPWPFRMHRAKIHGIKLEALEGQVDAYPQRAAYNHGFRMLGHLSQYMTNLDLDEYLYNRTGMPLADYMARKTKLFPYWHLYRERYANVAEPQIEYPVRAIHFRHQRAKVGPSRGKYFYRTGSRRRRLKPTWIAIHTANYQGEYLRILLRVVWAKVIHKVLRLKRFSDSWPQDMAVPPSDLILYHLDGIRTDWDHALYRSRKKGDVSFPREEPDPNVFKVNDELPALLRRVGLTD